MGEPAFQLPDEDQPDIRPDLRALEGGGETTPPKSGHLRAIGDGETADTDDSDGDTSDAGGGSSAAVPGDEAALAAGSGAAGAAGGGLFNAAGSLTPMGRFGKLGKAMWGSKRRKAATVGAGVGVAGVGAGIVAMLFMLLPLKIESLVNDLQNRAGAASMQAVGTETNNLFKEYMIHYVLPNIGKPGCHSTVDAGCVSVIKSDGLVARVYKGWRNERLEQKLATRYNLTFGKDNGRFYISTDGHRIDFRTEGALADALEGHGTNAGTKTEIERALRDHLKEGTLWDRIYYRFRIAPFVEKKYGIRYCINACKIRNTFTEPIRIKKKAAKAYTIRRVITPLSESYGIIMQCMLEPSGACSTAIDQAQPGGDPERDSPVDKQLQQQLDRLADTFGKDTLQALAKTADDIGKDGFTKVIAQAIGDKVGSMLGQEGGGEVASKAVPAIGWAFLIAKMVNGAKNIGTTVKYLGYAANAAAAAQIFTMYQTVANETKSGQIDSAQLGSFNQALDTNLSGMANDSSSATQTPLYHSMMASSESSAQTALLPSSLSSTAFAATATPQDPGYLCSNGKPVPAGKLVCAEEVLDRGNTAATDISDVTNQITGSIPGLNGLLKAVGKAGDVFNSVFGSAFNVACHTVGWAVGCPPAMNWIGGQAGQLMNLLITKIIASPITANMSGGRTFDMMSAGSQVVYNSSCQTNIGCAHISNQDAANIQAAYLQQKQDSFDRQSLYARMFNTDTPYSLVSQLAVAMPSSLSVAGGQLASTISQNPLSAFGSLFASIFTTHQAFAATATANNVNPFGVPQTGYLPSEIPNNPEQFWNKNCIKGPEGWYDSSTQKLDVSRWLNNPKNVVQDKNTGQAIYLRPNRCLLIMGAVQSGGGLADPSLLPQDSLNDTGTTGGGQLRVATFNVEGQPHTPTTWKQRADKAISAIESKQPDIIGFQEFERDQPQYFLGHLTDYSSFGGSPNAIVWRKDKYSIVASGMQPNLLYFCSAGSNNPSKLKAPYVKLRDDSTGQQFYVLNTHDPANSVNDHCSDPSKNRYLDALEHVKFIKQLSKEGLPIILTGDFNSRYDLQRGGNGSPYQGKAANLTYCIFTTSGVLNDAYDAYSNRSVTCPNKTPPGAGGGIDHVYLSKQITVGGYTSVAPGTDGSDHPALFYDITMPGSSNSSAAAQTGSSFVGNDGFPGGSCVAYVEYILKRHSSNYHGGTLGNGKDVANSLKRYGYQVDHRPALHATVSFPTSLADPTYGHVALVAKVNANGSIVVEEANWSNSDRYGTHTVAAGEVSQLTYAHTEKGWH